MPQPSRAVRPADGCQDSGRVSDNILVSYRRSGGIVGYDDQLTIYYDGRFGVKRKRGELKALLEPNALAHLKGLMQQVGFSSLKEEYLSAPGGADMIDYFVVYEADCTKYTVHTDDGAMPHVLQPVIAELNRIITRQR